MKVQAFNIPRLIAAYYTEKPDVADRSMRVSFGTSGHRGTSLNSSFNDSHIAAVSQAICEYRTAHGICGPLFMGMDTHALSEAALRTATEVFAANDVELRLQEGFSYTPTPVISHAIIEWNRTNKAIADGVVITPSHNPPSDGGFKYNPPSGGPAGTDVTKFIETRANEIIAEDLSAVKRVPFAAAIKRENVKFTDYIEQYTSQLAEIISMDKIRASGIKIGADPLGGSGIYFWQPIAERYGLDIEVVNESVDPYFSFMPPDHDGKIRMDCSSPWAMANLVALKDKYDISFGNDPDYDRHGIVTRDGLMQPNAYLAVAIEYLFTHRTGWSSGAMTGKTLVSSGIIDRVAASVGRKVYEV
ncbi:MAG: phosphoglucomutase, alpha-D-glucose phosphate-specific, partial [Synergistes sp.]|nr:phosphoglucomutase, alpha-D-glucose phosphate-specific [Synergistes sp.]